MWERDLKKKNSKQAIGTYPLSTYDLSFKKSFNDLIVSRVLKSVYDILTL